MVAYVPPKQAGKYKAVASGAITNGKPVLVNSTGTVSVPVDAITQALGSEVVYQNQHSLDYTSIGFDSTSGKVIVLYQRNSSGGTGTSAKVGTVSDTSISFGSEQSITSSFNYSGHASIVHDTNSNRMVMGFKTGSSTGNVVVATVSGTSMSFGSLTEFTSGNLVSHQLIFDSSNNKVVLVYRDNSNSSYGTAKVGTVDSSDNSISFGTAVVFNSGSSKEVTGTFDSNSNKIVAFYRDQGDSHKGKAIVGTVSGTSISFGSEVEYVSALDAEAFQACTFDSTNNKVIIAYADDGDSDKGKARVGTVSGTSISFGTAVEFEAGSSDKYAATFDSSVGKVVIGYEDDGDSAKGKFVIGTVSGTDISFTTPAVFNEHGTLISTNVTFDSTNNRVVFGYTDNQGSGGDGVGTAIVLRNAKASSAALTTENYIGIASGGTYADTAEATIDVVGTVNKDQSGLTAGQTYYVQTDGTLGTTADDPSVVAGTAISATELIVKG